MAAKKKNAESQEVQALLKRLFDSGMTPAQVAEKLQTSVRSVYRWRDEGVVPFKFHLTMLQELVGKVKSIPEKEK